MAAAFVAHRCDTRQAGQLYTAWRKGTRVVRERILAEPELFLKTQRQPPAAKPAAVEQVERDLEMAIAILHRAGRRLAEALPEMNGSATETSAGPDRKRAAGTGADGGTNRKGAGSETC